MSSISTRHALAAVALLGVLSTLAGCNKNADHTPPDANAPAVTPGTTGAGASGEGSTAGAPGNTMPPPDATPAPGIAPTPPVAPDTTTPTTPTTPHSSAPDNSTLPPK